MTIDLFHEKNACRIRIEGDLTIYTATEVTQTIRECLLTNPAIVIDLNGVSEIDTAGLQVLLVAKKESLLRNRGLGFIGPSSVVSDCLRLVNLANFFKFESAAAAA